MEEEIQYTSEDPDIFTADGIVETIIPMPDFTPIDLASIHYEPIKESILPPEEEATEPEPLVIPPPINEPPEVFLPPVALTLYNKNTGQILGTYIIPEHTKIYYENDDQGFINGSFDPISYEVNLETGEAVAKDRSAELLADLQVRTHQKIKDVFEEEMSLITSNYPQSERDSFAIQEEEAKRFIEDSGVATPTIDAILTELTGVDKTYYANSILQKSAAFKALVGGCIGRRKARQIQFEAVKNDYEQLLTFINNL